MADPTTQDEPRTGDLLLFSGWGQGAVGIRLATASTIVHVGVAVWLTVSEHLVISDVGARFSSSGDTPETLSVGRYKDEPRRLYCFETNNNVMYDRLTGNIDHGTRLVPLDLLLPKYTYVAWRRVKLDRTPDFYRRFWAFIEEYSGQPYHRNKMRMVLSALGIHFDEHEPSDRAVFCSQLVARYLQRFDLIPSTILPYTCLPRHYSAHDHSGGPIPNTIFDGPELTYYNKPSLEWHSILLIIVATLVVWIGLYLLERHRRINRIRCKADGMHEMSGKNSED